MTKENKNLKYDVLIIGSGIVGLTIAKEINEKFPTKKILIIEKEHDIGFHSSGRNSGVLHAGFYYTSNSLKAKFTRIGNKAMTDYCLKNNIKINRCKKVVVVQDETELDDLQLLFERGQENGVDVSLIDEKELADIEPNAKTIEKALFSPTTSTVDPIEVCKIIKQDLIQNGIDFKFNCSFLKKIDSNTIKTNICHISADIVINAAGLYADKIAKQYGFSKKYTIIPFKGIYLKYKGSDSPVNTNIYPVPNLKNPFLGVHYTITVDNSIKIGPTAIPAFWRENYQGLSRFNLNELFHILFKEAELFFTNSFNFRQLAYKEMKKYNKKYFTHLASKLVKNIDEDKFIEWTKPGLRAQLLDINTNNLIGDFVVEGDKNSIHVLNAVSPGFTSSFPFAKWIVENYLIC